MSGGDLLSMELFGFAEGCCLTIYVYCIYSLFGSASSLVMGCAVFSVLLMFVFFIISFGAG